MDSTFSIHLFIGLIALQGQPVLLTTGLECPYMYGIDYTHEMVKHYYSGSPVDCQEKCNQNPKCGVWVWLFTENGTAINLCFLKKAQQPESIFLNKLDKVVVSGRRCEAKVPVEDKEMSEKQQNSDGQFKAFWFFAIGIVVTYVVTCLSFSFLMARERGQTRVLIRKMQKNVEAIKDSQKHWFEDANKGDQNQYTPLQF